MDPKKQLDLDIRRTIILGGYIRHWGMPRDRIRFHKHEDEEVVEAYLFPATSERRVARIATVGNSAFVREGVHRCEFMLGLPEDLGEATFAQAAGFLMDFCLYARKRGRLFAGLTVPASPLVPTAWAPRALLLDEPRSEPEELTAVHVGEQHVDLWWVVPIYASEYQFINQKGVEAFDVLAEAHELSLADVRRPAFV